MERERLKDLKVRIVHFAFVEDALESRDTTPYPNRGTCKDCLRRMRIIGKENLPNWKERLESL